MNEKRKFPLIVWEHTQEAQKELEQAGKIYNKMIRKLDRQGFQCIYMGDLRFDNNCEPEIFINSCMPSYAKKRIKTARDALDYALKYGSGGWWNLNELDAFSRGMSIILNEAMWDLGYRKNKVNNMKWSRKTAEDKRNPARTIRWNDKFKKEFFRLDKEERARLENLDIILNSSAGSNNTYSLSVCKRDMIYVELKVNPFSASKTEDFGWLSHMLNNRGHIAKQQESFCIDAKNVRLKDEEKIYIKAIKPDKKFAEVIWPTAMPADRIYDLADDLVSKVAKV